MWEQVDQAETRKDELGLLADIRRGLEIGHRNSLRLLIELFGLRLEGSADQSGDVAFWHIPEGDRTSEMCREADLSITRFECLLRQCYGLSTFPFLRWPRIALAEQAAVH